MMESILLENVLEKRQLNCNGEMLVIDGSNAGFGGVIYIYIYILNDFSIFFDSTYNL